MASKVDTKVRDLTVRNDCNRTARAHTGYSKSSLRTYVKCSTSHYYTQSLDDSVERILSSN